MIAKKEPSPDPGEGDGEGEETRKVDAMSEIVAGMLLDDPDATAPPPDATPGSFSAVRATQAPQSTRPPALATEEPAPSPGARRAVVIALVIALALALVL